MRFDFFIFFYFDRSTSTLESSSHLILTWVYQTNLTWQISNQLSKTKLEEYLHDLNRYTRLYPIKQNLTNLYLTWLDSIVTNRTWLSSTRLASTQHDAINRTWRILTWLNSTLCKTQKTPHSKCDSKSKASNRHSTRKNKIFMCKNTNFCISLKPICKIQVNTLTTF